MTQTHEPTDSQEPGTLTSVLDTEGHFLPNAEYAGAVMRDRQRDDARSARDEARRRELKKPARSLRSRLFGR
jgi:hypothetical protein